jgi:hypothetical protein
VRVGGGWEGVSGGRCGWGVKEPQRTSLPQTAQGEGLIDSHFLSELLMFELSTVDKGIQTSFRKHESERKVNIKPIIQLGYRKI